MKKIIKGKTYNTETAKMIGEVTSGSPKNFEYLEETLYQKKTGEYFLYGFGGAMTQYRTKVDQNSWTGGEKITPLSLDEAMEWAEDNLTGDEYEEIFGLPDEDGEETEVRAWVSPAAKAKLDRERARAGETVKEIIERLLIGLPG